MELPETRYARSGDVSIAYQVFGDGPFDLVHIPPMASLVELSWRVPGIALVNRRLAAFARCIRCACAISEGVRALGIEIRAGLHTGECERIDNKVGGIAVNIGARVAAEAASGEVLVSSTVKDLVAGSDLRFEDRGEHHLKGIPEPWRLFAVMR